MDIAPVERRALAVYVLTRQGLELARRLRALLPLDIHALSSLDGGEGTTSFGSLHQAVAAQFSRYSGHIFITAAGIAVRCIAPHIRDKSRDPAVLVLDQRGRHVISLLSGHLGGANELARKLAKLLGGEAVITTATDTEGLPSFDLLAREQGLAIHNIAAVAQLNAALLAGEPVLIDDPQDRMGLKDTAERKFFLFASKDAGEHAGLKRVVVSPKALEPEKDCLLLHPPVLHAGIGCRRGTRAESILEAIDAALHKAALAPASLCALASISAKQDEAGLLEAAKRLALPLRFFAPEDLAHIPVSSPSPKAQAIFGVNGVCEPAALLSGGAGSVLRLEKYKHKGVTVAIAEEKA